MKILPNLTRYTYEEGYNIKLANSDSNSGV